MSGWADWQKETLQEIRGALKAGEWEKAERLIDTELSMPYVDPAFREALEEEKEKIPGREPKRKAYAEEELGRMLRGDAESQAAAVTALSAMNLRSHLGLCEEYLCDPHADSLAAGSLIASLHEQQVTERMAALRNGKAVRFRPAEVVLPERSGALRKTLAFFDQWYGSDEPTAVQLFEQAALEEAYRTFPRMWKEEDSEREALAFVRFVFSGWGREEEALALIRQRGFLPADLPGLVIENRGNHGIIGTL